MTKFYTNVSDLLLVMERKSTSSRSGVNSTDLHKHILELKDMLDIERNQYFVSFRLAVLLIFISYCKAYILYGS